MEPLIDRRIFQRLAGDFTGWYSVRGAKEILGEFSGLDFSAGGIKVRSGKKILEGRALDLSLVSAAATAPVSEAAQIVWQREANPGIWEAGLEFYQPDLIHLHPFISPREYSAEEQDRG